VLTSTAVALYEASCQAGMRMLAVEILCSVA